MLALTHFYRWAKGCELELYYDPKVNPQAVGEGSTLDFPVALYENIGFIHDDLKYVNGSFKGGIYKTGWGSGNTFIHHFPPPNVGYHFNAVKLQEHILNLLKDKISITEQNVSSSDIDADFVMDCSGKPNSYNEFHLTDSIPVNSVHVTPCYWDHARFQHTLTLARPYGWVFGIPLQNRCSIGYMYNNTINSLEEVKEDVKQIFKEYNLTPSTDYNTFSFKNYYKKENFTNRVAFNGNASFFLEPLEATSIALMNLINKMAYEVWFNNGNPDLLNIDYVSYVQEIETVIMLHYFAGSIFKTPFWEFAQERATKIIERAKQDKKFNDFVAHSKLEKTTLFRMDGNYGTWGGLSFKQNLENLNLYDKLNKI